METFLQIMNLLSSVGAPALALMLAALTWDRKRLLQELKEERTRTEELADRLAEMTERLVQRVLRGKNSDEP